MQVNTDSQTNNGLVERLATGIRQEQIANAALQLISEQGIESLSIAAIANELGLVPSAVYRHYANKEEILYAVNRLITQRLISNIQRVSQESQDPVERLQKLLYLHVGIVQKNDGVPRYVFSTGVESGQSERKQLLFQGVRIYLERVAELFAAGQKSGRIRQELDPDTLAYMFLGLIQPAIFLGQLGDGHYDIETQVEKAWQVFIRGILLT